MCYLPAQRNCKVENREHQGPCVFGEQVSNDGWCNSRVTGFTNANQAPGEHKEPEILKRDKEIETLAGPPLAF